MRPQNSFIMRLLALMFLSALTGIAGMGVDGAFNNADAALTEADCRACHNETYISKGVEVSNTAEVHHRLQRANLWGCTLCHDPAVPGTTIPDSTPPTNELDCLICHASVDHAAAHDMATVPSVDCEQCHNANVVTEHVTNRGLDCSVCHDSVDPTVQATIQTGMSGTLVYCSDCHGTVDHSAAHDMATVPSPACEQCHSANVVTEHVTNRGLTCDTCHSSPDAGVQAAIQSGMNGTTVYCSACHTQTDHHTTAEAQSGNCTYCHADPRLEIDPNAPTGQLACRQCHGTNMHNNGGPIQDYGACFACHAPVPYHGKPTTWPGWYEENAAAPGRGSFNLFYNEFQPDCAGNCEHSNMENRSGYGEHSQPASDRGRNWSTPSIDYTMVTIFDYFTTNQEWTVPTFGDGGGTGGGGGGGADNDSITITRAQYSSEYDRLTVYATNTQGQNATLSVQYNNGTYPMTWDSEDNRWQVRISSSSCSDSIIEVVSSAGGSASSSVSNCGGSSDDH